MPLPATVRGGIPSTNALTGLSRHTLSRRRQSGEKTRRGSSALEPKRESDMKYGAGALIVSTLLMALAPIAVAHEGHDSIELPVGDGHVTDHPAVGNVYACQTKFRAGGATHDGRMVSRRHLESGREAARGRARDVAASGVRADPARRRRSTSTATACRCEQPTGIFPISPSDPAYRYDPIPMRSRKRNSTFAIPATPARAPRTVPAHGHDRFHADRRGDLQRAR